MSEGTGTDEQRIEGHWFNDQMAQDKVEDIAARRVHVPGMWRRRQFGRSHHSQARIYTRRR